MGRKNDYRDDELLLSRTLSGAGMGLLRITLLFGSAAIALALIIAPLADRGIAGGRRLFDRAFH